MKKILFIISLSGLLISCSEEQNPVIAESDTDDINLPTVKSYSYTDEETLSQINDLLVSQEGRSLSNMSYEDAISATYEGYESIELTFIPSTTNDQIFYMFIKRDGQLIQSNFSVINKERELVLNTEAGSANFEIEENKITGVSVQFNDYNEGRIDNEFLDGNCDPGGDYLACLDTIQDQLVEEVGPYGTLAFDLACSLWVICRGAVVLSCTLGVGVDCI